MEISIRAKWYPMSMSEVAAQMSRKYDANYGAAGFLREEYHGAPYATKALVPEAFKYGDCSIPAKTLKERLPEALHVAETRERVAYGTTDPNQIETILKNFRDFVALCARKEEETGWPCVIYAS